MDRRSFLTALASLPFMKWVKPAESTIHFTAGNWARKAGFTNCKSEGWHYRLLKADGTTSECCCLYGSRFELKRPTQIEVEFTKEVELKFDFNGYLPHSDNPTWVDP